MRSLTRAAAFLFFILAVFYARACLNICGWSPPSSLSTIDKVWRIAQNGLFVVDRWLMASGREWGACLIFMIAYGCIVFVSGRIPPRTLMPLILVAAFAAAILLFTRTCYSTDMYDYLVRGRLLVLHHSNPFVVPPSAFPNDPYFPLINWPRAVWVYGPLWLLVVSAVAAVPAPVLGGVLMLRLLMTVAHLLNGRLLWRILADAPADRRARQTALYLFCPLALWESAINAHCDLLMITFLLGGTLAARWDRTRAAVVCLALAALIKAYAGPALIFFGVAAVTQAQPGRRCRTAFAIVAIAATMAAVAYAPFFHTPSALLTPFRSAAAGSLANSWAATQMVLSWLKPARAIALGHIVMAAGFVWGVMISRRKHGWQEGAAWFFVIFCSITTWFQPWYAVMALAMAVTAESAALKAAAVTLVVLAPISYVTGCMGWSTLTCDRIQLLTQLLPLNIAVFAWGLRHQALEPPAS